MMLVFSWNLQLTPLGPDSPISLAPNPTVSENLQLRKAAKEPSCAFLAAVAATPLKFPVAQDPA